VKDRRGPLGSFGALADEAAATLRRRQADREPKIVIYDDSGRARTLTPGEESRRHLLEAAEELIELAGGGPQAGPR